MEDTNQTFLNTWNVETNPNFSPELLFFASTCVVAFIIFGVTGNLITIIALAKDSRLRTPTSAFIISLSLADFLFCAINLPLSASRFIHGTWIHSNELCSFFPFFRYANVAVSLFSIVAITLYRYIAIVHPTTPLNYCNSKVISCLIVFMWVLAFSTLLPTLFGKWGQFDYDPMILNCSIVEVNGQSPKTFLFIFGFVFPCVVIVLCYFRIFWIVRSSRRIMHKHEENTTGFAIYSQAQTQRRQDELRMTRTILTIFIAFVLCYLPITLVKVIDKRGRYPVLQVLSYLFLYLSSCINPLIYALSNRQYRNAYATLLFCNYFKSNSNTTDSRDLTHSNKNYNLTISVIGNSKEFINKPNVEKNPTSTYF